MRPHTLATILVLGLVASTACSSNDGSSTSSSSGGGTTTGGSTEVRATSLGTQARAASAAYAAQIDVLRVASAGFTLDLTKDLPPLEASGPQADALAKAVAAHAKWMATTGTLTPGGTTSGALATTSRHVGLRARAPIGSVRSAIIGIDDALILGGIALTAWAASKGIGKAVAVRTAPAEEKIKQASAADLAVINESLGLPNGTTKEEALAKFGDLGMGGRLSKAKQIEQDLRLAETNGKAVEPVAAEKIQRAVAESSVECGKTALKTTVSASTFSGQGYSQVAQALGASERTAAVVDFTISAVSEATNTPLQPLDKLADHLDATFASKATAPVALPPTPAMTKEGAAEVLGQSDPKLADFLSAIDAQVHAVVDPIASLLGAIVGGDGSGTVNVPTDVHQASVDAAKNVQVVQVRQIGPAFTLVATDCHGAQRFSVDTSAAGGVAYAISSAACGEGDCSADLQLVDPAVSIPEGCEKCINASCGSACAACNPTCVRKVEACYDACDAKKRDCMLGCACSGDGCGVACNNACYGASATCDDACGKTPEAQGSDAIGTCIQTVCAEACASVIK